MTSNPNLYQEQYWKQLLQVKYCNNYISEYIATTEKYDRNINIFLAIASNGSICSWAIWNSLGLIWGAIIATSQLINAIKHLLPFEKRKKSFYSLSKDLQSVFIYAEKQWYDVAEGLIENNIIHNLTIELKQRVSNTYNNYFNESNLPENKKITNKAIADTEKYFINFYLNGVNHV